MDAKKYLAALADDEGVTDGIGDEEAKVLLDWLKASLQRGLAPVKEAKAADELVAKVRQRGRQISKVVEALCVDEDAAKAKKLWVELGRKEPLDKLPAADAVAAMKQIIAWEDTGHA